MARISAILDRKGTDVATIAPDASLLDAARRLDEHNIGSLVVSNDGRAVEGILSERDIVRRLAAAGPSCLDDDVATVMTTDVVTRDRTASVDELMGVMTDRRIRHIPIVESGELVGLVSIGDVVKSRIVELEVERNALEDYVTEGQPAPRS